MSRLITTLAALSAATALSGAATAADDLGDFRGSYPSEWEMEEDTLDFELGLRYWYSLGSQGISAFGDDYSLNDESHIIEGHFRVEDDATSSYLKGLGGYAGKITGTYSTPSGNDFSIQGGTVQYLQGDFGWMPLGDDNFRIGGLVGYQYWNDSPDQGRFSFFNAQGGDSEPNNFDVHSLRLGVTSKFDLTEMFDITAEVAAVPYGFVSGTFGAHEIEPFFIGPDQYEKASATIVNGRLFGAQAELMFGVHPTENITLRVGGRAWYLTGPVEVEFDMGQVADPNVVQRFIGELDNFSLFRYGAMAELTYRF